MSADYSEDHGVYLSPIPQRLVKKWERAVKRVSAVMEEICDVCPYAQHYQQEDTAILLYGPSHEGLGDTQQQREQASVRIRNSDGGAW